MHEGVRSDKHGRVGVSVWERLDPLGLRLSPLHQGNFRVQSGAVHQRFFLSPSILPCRMKFGKYIKSMAHPAWADKYVDYKLLKTYLKPFEAGAVNQEYEDLFLSCLHAEINKVDSFFTAKETEFLQEQRGFWDKVRQTKAEPCKKVCTTRQDLIAAFDGTEMGEVLECFVAFTSKVETLRDFVMLNLQAVVKITKKHDKHSDTYLQTDLVQQVHMRNFFRSKKFGELIADVEALAMHLISHLVAWDELPDGWDGKSACGAGFQCPICLEHLCNPILLPCGHRFSLPPSHSYRH